MSTNNRASNRTQDSKGRAKDAAGILSGNRNLDEKDKMEQGKAEMKKNIEDAGLTAVDNGTP